MAMVKMTFLLTSLVGGPPVRGAGPSTDRSMTVVIISEIVITMIGHVAWRHENRTEQRREWQVEHRGEEGRG